MKQISGLSALAAMMLAELTTFSPGDGGSPTLADWWLVPTDGGTPTPLTAPNSGQEGEVLGACGYRFLAKVDTFGETPTKVSVPDVDEHKSGEALVDYDPTKGTSTALLGTTVNGGGVMNAIVYPGYE